MPWDGGHKQIFENKVQANVCPSGEQVPLAGDTAHLRCSLRRESFAWHLPRLRRAVASCCVVAVALLLNSSHGRLALCRCYFCIPLDFFHVQMQLFTFRAVVCYFLQLVCVQTAPLNQGIRVVYATLSK